MIYIQGVPHLVPDLGLTVIKVGLSGYPTGRKAIYSTWPTAWQNTLQMCRQKILHKHPVESRENALHKTHNSIAPPNFNAILLRIWWVYSRTLSTGLPSWTEKQALYIYFVDFDFGISPCCPHAIALSIMHSCTQALIGWTSEISLQSQQKVVRVLMGRPVQV